VSARGLNPSTLSSARSVLAPISGFASIIRRKPADGCWYQWPVRVKAGGSQRSRIGWIAAPLASAMRAAPRMKRTGAQRRGAGLDQLLGIVVAEIAGGAHHASVEGVPPHAALHHAQRVGDERE